jgi:serine protease AprX
MIKKQQKLIALLVTLTFVWLLQVPTMPLAAASIAPYSDVRYMDLHTYQLGLGLIRTLWFNENTEWSAKDRVLAEQVMAEGKNPGLGVNILHHDGITGAGVNVAIIDKQMLTDHPEYAGKIINYVDFGTGSTSGSMHGSAVTSILVGNTIGTAPGAKVYYAAVPTWKLDAQYYADALNWITVVSESLPRLQKIRVVSVQAAPYELANSSLWAQACSLADANGILVLTSGPQQGIIKACYYDFNNPEEVAYCTPGFPTIPTYQCTGTNATKIRAPSSFRTQAEEYTSGVYYYQYQGEGGVSWSIPYVAGVLAMGWQLKPELTKKQMVKILMSSAYDMNGCHIIDPVNFIRQLSGE